MLSSVRQRPGCVLRRASKHARPYPVARLASPVLPAIDTLLSSTLAACFHMNRMETPGRSSEPPSGYSFQSIRMETFPWKAAEVQDFSAELFGNAHRLEVALAILSFSAREPHRVYKQALADALDVKDPEVEKHLSAFRNTGLLERHPNPPKDPRAPTTSGKKRTGRPPAVFRPTNDHFWQCLGELGERFRRGPPRSTRSPSSGAAEEAPRND